MASDIRKRTTRQLTAVYETLQGDHSHPGAEEIHRRVRKLSPKVSLGTVYRNLQRLAEGRFAQSTSVTVARVTIRRSKPMTTSSANSVDG